MFGRVVLEICADRQTTDTYITILHSPTAGTEGNGRTNENTQCAVPLSLIYTEYLGPDLTAEHSHDHHHHHHHRYFLKWPKQRTPPQGPL